MIITILIIIVAVMIIMIIIILIILLLLIMIIIMIMIILMFVIAMIIIVIIDTIDVTIFIVGKAYGKTIMATYGPSGQSRRRGPVAWMPMTMTVLIVPTTNIVIIATIILYYTICNI